MNILGISAFYHDSAAALVVDGEVVAAAQEERFTRIKHDATFPKEAIGYCLKEAGICEGDLDYVVFYEKPLLKFERLLETYIAFAPRGFASFRRAIPIWAKEKLFLRREIRKGLKKQYSGPIVYPEHHESHAASAFFPSPFEEAAILTIDGVGEWSSTTLGYGRGNKIELLQEQRFPHSLGLIYSAFTYYCGFRVNSGEYKLMGLAPYGEPRYHDTIIEHLIDIKEDGSYRMDMAYFNYCQGVTMTGKRFHELFGQEPRKPETELSQFHMDVAASIQAATEDIVLRMAKHAQERTGSKNLCLAGGVALNCVANGRLLREGPFENVWIQPAAGDAGGALGAALFTWYQLLENERPLIAPDAQKSSYLGPEFSDDEISTCLDRQQAVYHTHSSDETLATLIAELLADEKVVGLFQGRMEFGPRALGGRSILGDARSTSMQKVMNLKIKFRESFRPFAPSILEDHVSDYFDMRRNEDTPYMLLVADVHPDKLLEHDSKASQGLDKLNTVRSVIPAVTHVDNSARVQTVTAERHGFYHKLLAAFHAQTGSPVLINTSFNVRGEPIVGSPEDAYRCFMATNMDALVIGHQLLLKPEQPNATEIPRDVYLEKFTLD